MAWLLLPTATQTAADGHPPGPTADERSVGELLVAPAVGGRPAGPVGPGRPAVPDVGERPVGPVVGTRSVAAPNVGSRPTPPAAGARSVAPTDDDTSGVDLILPVAAAGTAVAVASYSLVRRRRRAQLRTTPTGTFEPPTTPLPDLHRRAQRLLVETDDSVRTSTEELRFAAARPGHGAAEPLAEGRADRDETETPAERQAGCHGTETHAEEHTGPDDTETHPKGAAGRDNAEASATKPADHSDPKTPTNPDDTHPHTDSPTNHDATQASAADPAHRDGAEPGAEESAGRSDAETSATRPPGRSNPKTPTNPDDTHPHTDSPTNHDATQAPATDPAHHSDAEPDAEQSAGRSDAETSATRPPGHGDPKTPAEPDDAQASAADPAHRDGAEPGAEESAGTGPVAARPQRSVGLDPGKPFVETPAARDAVQPFVEALADARGELVVACRAGLRLDEERDALSPDEERALLEEILTRCTTAQRRLDTATPAFDQLRALERDITPALECAEARFRELTGRTATAATTLTALRDGYAPAASLPVTGHVEQAKDRLVFATTELNRARQAAYPGDLDTAAVHLRAAEGAIDQADMFVTGVERLAAELARATATAERGAPDAGAYDDPLDVLRRQDRWLLPARSAVAAAGDFITTHRGAVGAKARTRLWEAERHLDLAQAVPADSAETEETEETGGRAENTRHAQRAHALAQEARHLAEQDVRAYGNPYGGPVGDGLGGALLGGIILGEPSDGGGRADLRGPACFGGTATRARRTAGGQF